MPSLYVIIDPAAACGRDLAWLTQRAIRGGADVIQLRDKAATIRKLTEQARRLREVTAAAGIPLIVNDHPDAAQAARADGVHLGQDDLPVERAREVLGPGAIIGKSTHSLAQAQAAMLEAVDYIGVGPVFATPTKPDYPQVGLQLIRQVCAEIQKPFVAIGGIDLDGLSEVLASGARSIAVVRAVCSAEDPEAAARALKAQLRR